MHAYTHPHARTHMHIQTHVRTHHIRTRTHIQSHMHAQKYKHYINTLTNVFFKYALLLFILLLITATCCYNVLISIFENYMRINN